MDEGPELVGVLGREAEHLGDDTHGDVLGVLGGGVDGVPAVPYPHLTLPTIYSV